MGALSVGNKKIPERKCPEEIFSSSKTDENIFLNGGTERRELKNSGAKVPGRDFQQ